MFRVWQQAEDVRFLLDQLLSSNIKPHIDPNRISVIGFSLGGYTSLALAGIQLELQRFAQYCQQNNPCACNYFASEFPRLDDEFYQKANASQQDPRIKATISIAPGFTESITKTSLKRLKTPVLLISAQHDQQTQVHSLDSPFVDALEISDAGHFSFLPQCLPGTVALLTEEGEEFVCMEPRDKTRAQIQYQVRQAVSRFLARHGLLHNR